MVIVRTEARFALNIVFVYLSDKIRRTSEYFFSAFELKEKVIVAVIVPFGSTKALIVPKID